MLLLDLGAFSSLAELLTNIFGLSLEITHLTIYVRGLKICILKVGETEEFTFTRADFSQGSPSVPLSVIKIEQYFQERIFKVGLLNT